MEGPYCDATRDAGAKTSLPKFIFVAGVEGSGHHALLSVWEKLRASVAMDVIVFDQTFHQLGIENHASYHYSRISLDDRREAMRPVFEHAAKNNAIVIDAQNSYPMGQYAGSLSHPDLVQLAQLDGVLYDLRVIVLYRNPTDTVMSAVRRFRDATDPTQYKNSQFQARAVAESLVAINNALPHLPCSKWVMLQFEEFAHNPKLLLGPLSRLLELPKATIEPALRHIRMPAKHTESPELQAERRVLNEFFARQCVLWPLLASAAKHTPAT